MHAGGGGVLCDIPPQKKGGGCFHLIAIEGPDLSAVNFDDIFKQKNRRIRL